MALDPRLRRYLEVIAFVGGRATTLEGRRASLEGLGRLAGAPVPVAAVEDLDLAGPAGSLAARLYRPVEATGAVLLYFHGGGFVGGSLDAHDGIARRLAAASGCALLATTYRLAPEHPFPAACEDALAALAALPGLAAARGLDATRLAVGGDSAGANLAAGLCQAARAGGPAIALQLLLCPVLDAAGEGESYRLYGEGHGLDRATLAHDIAAYAAGADPADPRLSPLRAPSLAGLPPAHIHTAECDMVRDDGAAYAARLARAGIPVRHTCHPGMIHHFYGMAGILPEAGRALDAIGAALRAALAEGGPARAPAP
ncbi:Alpha/beta hydrolase fold-3 domain protein [Methylobacterium sp. 4-46]|uniref:alpha/beta hydrolase n=1 Tax=unclassified Methylobacterium TaxID=2615210 RepID=UPI000152E414|nr:MULTISPECIES: alpha/beta hydrolase [Methylobacterium]ACA19803.1 Alpha/beta hydrolase fold-3 domain protein [Methylobacterium sp. 4-46]WFT78988.1 alpha/beta hydrolase [Methylobacterium nodulans]